MAALAALALVGALAWLFGTEPGLHWALEQARVRSAGKLAFDNARGTLGGMVSLERLSFEADGTVIEARDVAFRAHVAALLGGRLVLDPLRIAKLDIRMAEGGGRPPQLPQLPFGLRLGQAEIGRLDFRRGSAAYAAKDIRIAYFDVGTTPPNAVSAEASFALEHERYPLAATLGLGGTLERLEAHLAFKLADVPADVRAVLTPFREPRLESIDARAGPIDLSRFRAGLPRTALGAAVKARGVGDGLAGALSLSNAEVGPLDDERLPIANVETRFASPTLASATLSGLRIALAGGGVLEGEGEVTAAGFAGKLQARGLNLRALRSSLRETQLAGPLELSLAREVQTLRGTLSQQGMSVSAEAVRKGDDIEVRSLRAAAEGGEVTGSGRLRLGDPLGFEAKLALARFNPAAFGDYPDGSISGSVRGHGQIGDEIRADIEWLLTDSNLLDQPFLTHGTARVAGRRVLQANAEAKLAGTWASVRGSFGAPTDKMAWTLEVPALSDHLDEVSGRLKASGTLSGTWSVPQAVIHAEAQDLRLPHGLRATRAVADISGNLARHEGRVDATVNEAQIQARLRGGFVDGLWSGEIASLDGRGKVPFHLRAPAPLKVARARVELGRFEASVGEGRLLVREVAWSRSRVASSGEFTGLPAQWLIAAAGMSDKLRGTLLLDGQWAITAAPDVDGTLRLRRASGDLAWLQERPVELGLQSIALDA
ncbi:MAG TPA: hypothetical protein VIV54_12535, partial [Burkholderiales bacterium]